MGGMTSLPSDAVIRAWTRLVKAGRVVLGAVEAELKAAGFPPLGWYDVLLELSREKVDGLRPFVLEERLLLAQYNLSRVLDRLVEAGYVERLPHPEDRRGQIVRITAAGRDLVKRMWPIYRAAIARHVGAKLAEDEAQALALLLERLVAAE
jgi:DNA-binding MarR family transcriptional regulator